LHHLLIFKITDMKRVKNGVSNFKQLTASQLLRIKGGYWVDVKRPDGTVISIWVN